jgi:hypothetical protein
MAKAPEFYRVMMVAAPGEKPKTWNVYRDLDAAIEAARGLLTSDIAVEAEVIWVRSREDQTSILRLVLDADGKVAKAR